jgi:hypothetical protein
MAPPPPARARPQLWRMAEQRRKDFKLIFQFMFLLDMFLIVQGLFLQNYIYTDSTSLNSGQREYYNQASLLNTLSCLINRTRITLRLKVDPSTLGRCRLTEQGQP